jgi:hypothetical protein
MPGFLYAATIVMSGGAIVGAGVLMILPESSKVPDLPPLSCQQQYWLNADRSCETWTVPHRDVEQFLASAPADTVENTAPTENMTVAERTPAKIPSAARSRAGGTAGNRAKVARIKAAPAAADSTRRAIMTHPTMTQPTMIRPTSRQDFPG